jgi:HEAT repeat protein
MGSSTINPYMDVTFRGREDRSGVDGANCELTELLANLRAARDSGLGACLQVRGNAGVGKTRLLLEFQRRGPAHECGVVYVKVTECGRHQPALELVKTIARRIVELDPEYRGDKRPFSRNLRRSFRPVASIVGDVGTKAGLTALVAGQLWGLVAMGGGTMLKAIVAAAEVGEGTVPTASSRVAEFCDALFHLNASLNRTSNKSAVAIVIDQWDDILRLTTGQRDDMRQVLETVVERLNQAHAGARRVFLCIGVRNERAALCLPPRAMPLTTLDVTPLRSAMAVELLSQPEGPDAPRNAYFTEEAAHRLASEYCGVDPAASQGDLAALLVVAANAWQRAVSAGGPGTPIGTGSSYAGIVAASVDDITMHAIDAFRQTATGDPASANAFTAKLAMVEAWDSIAPGDLAKYTDNRLSERQAADWLEWWARETQLLSGGGNGPFRFRHESYAIALSRSVYGGSGDELRQGKNLCEWALRTLGGQAPDGDDIRFVEHCLARVPPRAWAVLSTEWYAILSALEAHLSSSQDDLWWYILGLMRGFQHPSVDECLIRALEDPREDVRSMAAAALGFHHYQPALPSLATLLEDRAEKVRTAAASALVELGPLGLSELVRLARHPEANVCVAAIRALSKTEDATYFDIYVEALSDDSEQVAEAAAEVLGKQGDPRAVDPLVAYVRRRGDRDAWSAYRALEGMSPHSIEPLYEAVRAADPAAEKGFCMRAVLVLAGMGKPAWDVLVRLLRKGSCDLCLTVVAVLRGPEGTAFADGLRALLSDDDPTIRAYADTVLRGK